MLRILVEHSLRDRRRERLLPEAATVVWPHRAE
jgi:hypothetical protein